ncbi:high mobility group protein B4, putative [Plasmodium knowlesi strain H]|uniref:High mobility group protein B4, putative n=3 Tax=Plasmodium knowlesi TaxID=5850 RepID=A0A1A7VRS8_PLAKH|nr:high mobility group protein B4, putative [Plasmodium knowlesi strain H]OTN64682.1 putative High mobility group protein B4 [Plasmodium knowlesi]CAA9988950.1 high mobility group protein B4, putative [Plasmodium knowlesi strain H]SBO24794.1 high mobility group protein B4, putative [Plasmodium knowlesi strain H]SBO28057.1 high mobility group protein B4, putative [Plasmodium knowlesi strain H]VVS78424.1 high mobility group protein B4, putative [Plasmodium knowlesi strain H]
MDRKKPKIPPSSYLLFCNSERENVRQLLQEKSENKTTIRITDIQKELSSKWKNLSEEERKVYEEQAHLLKIKYNEELLDWKSGNADAAGDNGIISTSKFPVVKIQKIMHLNSNVRKINNEAINVFQKAMIMFLIELVNKTIEFKNEKNTSKFITSLDIIWCIKREGIKYKFLEDCLYLLKDQSINTFFVEEEENDESLFDLCHEDKKEYNYDVEEKKLSRMKRKGQGNKAKEKTTENRNIYADITTYFKKA